MTKTPRPSSKPVAGHAVPGPLCLTHPAPMEAAARLAADHVHAASVPLCGTGFVYFGLCTGVHSPVGVRQPGQGLVLTLMVTLLGSAPDHRALAARPVIWPPSG